MEPLELEFTVACDPARAFSLWAEQTTRWWPHGHSVSGGAEYDSGEVIAWKPLEARRDRNRRGWAGVIEHYRAAMWPTIVRASKRSIPAFAHSSRYDGNPGLPGLSSYRGDRI